MVTRTKDVYIPCGDYGYDIALTLYDASGNIFNPAGYTITLKVWTYDIPSTLLLSGVGGITSPVDGKVYYTLQNGDFNTEGEFIGEIELTKPSAVESFRTYIIHVTESG